MRRDAAVGGSAREERRCAIELIVSKIWKDAEKYKLFNKRKMTNIYSQRSLTVLAFLGVLSAIMSLLSVVLIFQLQSHNTGTKDSSSRPSVVPAEVSAVLMPVATVLTALSLTLNLSSVVVCLLHSYFTTEICKGEDDTDRYCGDTKKRQYYSRFSSRNVYVYNCTFSLDAWIP